MILAVTNEVVFAEMIEKAAGEKQAHGLALADEDAFWAALQEETPAVIFVDVGVMTLDAPALIEKLKQNPSTRSIPIVAFGNSLRADLLQDAKEMGADLILPKSAFQQQLPEMISHYLKKAGK